MTNPPPGFTWRPYASRRPRTARYKCAKSIEVRTDIAKMIGEVLDTLDALKTIVITEAMSQREFPLKVNYTRGPLLPPEVMTEAQRAHLAETGWEYGEHGWQRKPVKPKVYDDTGGEEMYRTPEPVMPGKSWHEAWPRAADWAGVPDPPTTEQRVSRLEKAMWGDEPSTSTLERYFKAEPAEGPVSPEDGEPTELYQSEPAGPQIATQGRSEATEDFVDPVLRAASGPFADPWTYTKVDTSPEPITPRLRDTRANP